MGESKWRKLRERRGIAALYQSARLVVAIEPAGMTLPELTKLHKLDALRLQLPNAAPGATTFPIESVLRSLAETNPETERQFESDATPFAHDDALLADPAHRGIRYLTNGDAFTLTLSPEGELVEEDGTAHKDTPLPTGALRLRADGTPLCMTNEPLCFQYLACARRGERGHMRHLRKAVDVMIAAGGIEPLPFLDLYAFEKMAAIERLDRDTNETVGEAARILARTTREANLARAWPLRAHMTLAMHVLPSQWIERHQSGSALDWSEIDATVARLMPEPPIPTRRSAYCWMNSASRMGRYAAWLAKAEVLASASDDAGLVQHVRSEGFEGMRVAYGDDEFLIVWDQIFPAIEKQELVPA